MHRCVLTGLMLASVASVSDGSITSTFDSDAEGWSTLNDAQGFMWRSDVGNPLGAIRANDIGNGDYWYFAASDDYKGDLSAFYGGTLSWELLGIVGNHLDDEPAEVMVSGAGLMIGIDIDYLPTNGTWAGAEVSLFADSWRLVDDSSDGDLSTTAVTEQQMRDVLADVTGLFIRGEFTTGGDSTALDNVMLVPTPASGFLMGLGSLAMWRRRGS
ncbi:MAG: laminin B domain-containing protein [Planctomycetota bacterium]